MKTLAIVFLALFSVTSAAAQTCEITATTNVTFNGVQKVKTTSVFSGLAQVNVDFLTGEAVNISNAAAEAAAKHSGANMYAVDLGGTTVCNNGKSTALPGGKYSLDAHGMDVINEAMAKSGLSLATRGKKDHGAKGHKGPAWGGDGGQDGQGGNQGQGGKGGGKK